MLLISKEEMEALVKSGLRLGKDIHCTHSNKRHKYYITENEWCINKLKKLREK